MVRDHQSQYTRSDDAATNSRSSGGVSRRSMGGGRGSVYGLGAGAGNTPLEVLAAVLERMGIPTGLDLFRLMDIAEEIITPMMDHMVRIDRDSLTLGYAGVYSTFLLHAKKAAEKYGLSARDILVELGRKKMIGGQEDMIQDTAMTLAKEKGLLKEAV